MTSFMLYLVCEKYGRKKRIDEETIFCVWSFIKSFKTCIFLNYLIIFILINNNK